MSDIFDQIRDDAHLWRARVDEGLDETERVEFRKWFDADYRHSEAYAEAELFWSAAALPGFEKDLLGTLGAKKDKPSRNDDPRLEDARSDYNTRSRWPDVSVAALALAASVAIAVFMGVPGIFLQNNPIEVQRFASQPGETTVITLPDRTRITLAPASELELALSETRRLTRLTKGGAFFDVTSNPKRPFEVESKLANVLVTGTRFDMQLGTNTVDVSVGKGSVLVSAKDKEEGSQALLVLQAVRFDGTEGFGTVREIYPAEFAAWRGGLLTYDNMTLNAVAQDVARYVEKPISVDKSVGGRIVNGTFNARDIDGLFRSLEEGMKVRVIEDDDTIRIAPR